jgi:hypothetical protein
MATAGFYVWTFGILGCRFFTFASNFYFWGEPYLFLKKYFTKIFSPKYFRQNIFTLKYFHTKIFSH